MTIRNSSSEYGVFSKALHWLVAIGLFDLIFFSLEQVGLERAG
jgi:cytochrome b561